MTYTSILVNLNLGQPNGRTLAVAQQLVQRFDTEVMGVAGGHTSLQVYDNGYASDDVFALERKAIESLLREAHEEFIGVFPGARWHATGKFESLSDFAVRHMRSADLVVTGVPTVASAYAVHAADTADMIMQAGRPVLVVPATCAQSALDWVLVAWKDTREARRAVVDALPLLARARHVQLLEIADEGDHKAAQLRLDDLATWLARHQVVAQTSVVLGNPDNSDQLGSIANELGADLVVAGAYGHSRLREWVLGGVTRNLLQGEQRCSLLSH